MAEELITKRLHVSGLTPAITPADLSQKLGAFGSVRALDGFGALDALGQPRKFGYVTLETTKAKLARCMNILSGVTWKGTKLRIGEAKPDFAERLAALRESEGEPPRKKRRLPRGVQGVHAADMSLVTPENVAGRGGWKVTPMGRLVKPIRMRPGHPLPEPVAAAPVKAKGKGKKEEEKKRRKRAKEPPTRARRQTIDPLKYGSQHLKGVFLENVVVEPRKVAVKSVPVEEESDGTDEESSEESEEEEGQVQVEEKAVKTAVPKPTPPPILSPATTQKVQQPPPPPALAKPPATNISADSTDLTQEKNAALGLLQSLFGNRDENDWGDKESLSDVDMEELAGRSKGAAAVATDDDIEMVPLESGATRPTAAASKDSTEDEEDSSEDEEDDESNTGDEPQAENVPPPAEEKAAAPPSSQKKLKDLFAPQAQEAGFSLLGQLDLDDELVDDVDLGFTAQAPATTAAAEVVQPISLPTTTGAQARFTLDPSAPLFFPIPEDERTGFRGRVKDPLDVAKEKGWDWRTFCRTETDEEVRKRWEERKVELTKDWKRRHREALKSRRRRGGAGDGE